METLEDLLNKIVDRPKDSQEEAILNRAKEHPEELETISNYLFSIKKKSDYWVQSACRKIAIELVKAFPSQATLILRPFFMNSIEGSSYSLYSRCEIFTSLIKTNTLTYADIVNIFRESVPNKPYTLSQESFLHFMAPNLRGIAPDLYEDLDSLLSELNIFIDQFKKPCYIPIVHHCDSTNPRISKFGGAAPYLPEKGPKVCTCEYEKLQTVFYLYIPGLPEHIRKLFPEDHEYVLAGYSCNGCYTATVCELFVDEEIDRIVFDSVPGADNIFNEPRTIIGWKESFSFPQNSDEYFHFPDQEKMSPRNKYFTQTILENKTNNNQTYLGGYPFFIQGDDSPSNYELFLEMSESEASTNLWGDCGTCQVWMSAGNDFGNFIMQYACS